MIHVDLVHNLAVLIALTAISGLAGRFLKSPAQGSLAQGALFGIAAVVCMMYPMPFASGIQFDARSVAINVCGAIYGPVAALMSAVIATAFRLSQGGDGATTGVLVALTAAVVGSGYYLWTKRIPTKRPWFGLWIQSVVAHLLMLALMFTLPGALAWRVLPAITPPVVILFPLTTVVLGLLLLDHRARRAQMAQLQETEDRFRLFLRHTPAAVAMLDSQMRYLAVSARWYKDYELTEENIEGRGHYEIFPDIPDEWKAVHQRCLEGASESRDEDRFERSDGRVSWVRWAIVPWRFASNEVGGILLFTEDITERKEAELQLAERERRYRSIFNQQYQYTVLLSPEGRILEINDLPLALVQTTREAVEGAYFWDTPWWRDLPEEQARWRTLLENARKGRPQEVRTIRYRDGKGAIRLADTVVAAVSQDSGALDYFIVQGTDVTESVRAQQESEAAKRLLESTFESMSDAVLVVDAPSRTIIRCNSAVSRVLGYSVDDITGARTRLLYKDDETYDRIGRESRLALEAGKTYRAEVPVCRKDGAEIHAEIAVSAINESTDWRNGVVCVLRDVTERKRAAEELSRMAARLTRTLESITDGFYTLDRSWRLTYLNPEAERLLRVSKENVLGRPAGEVFSDAMGGDIHTYLRQAATENRTIHFETYYPPFDAWFEAHAYPSKEGLAVYFRDVSDRVRASSELETLSKRLRDFLDFSPLAITEVTLDGRYLNVNRAAARFMSAAPEDVIGKPFRALLPEATARQFLERIRQVSEKGASLTVEDRIPLPETRYFSTTLFPLMDEHGEIASVGGIAQDITEQRSAEEERERLESQLRQAQRLESVGRLAGGVAHDFNNMLGVILGHAEMALQGLSHDDPLRPSLEEVQHAATRSADLTRQLLAFARRQTIAPKAMDLNDTIESMLKMLGRLVGEDIEIQWTPGKNLPPILADPSQVDQVLANLTVNARDAIDGNGAMRIETGAASFDEAFCASNPGYEVGAFVMLAVSDDGCGMDEGTIAQIFEPFFTTKPQGSGTGLGLATVYGIVQQNGGFLIVDSVLERGTTFRIYLPVHEAKNAAPVVPAEAVGAGTGSETILLVEDEGALLQLSQRMLERMGYTVLATASPQEALAAAGSYEGAIDLLMTDIIMPEMNGKELRRQIGKLRPGIPTLFISGYTADVIARHGALDPGVHFLQKPFKAGQLAKKVRESLSGAGGDAPSNSPGAE